MKRVKVSDNRRFLVTQDGEPFFWLGDTAWELFHRCSREDAEWYLENRRWKGFNVIQAVILAEFDGLTKGNFYGDLPLLDNDPARPNEAYFQHVDFVVQLAAEKGLYIGMLPTWGDKVNLMWGRGPVIFSVDNARPYGRWLAERYRDQPNVIWIMGGDRAEVTNGVDYAPVWREMAGGIRDVLGSDAFMTYHPCGGHGSSGAFHQDEWLDMNMWQSGHVDVDAPNWDMITQDYQRTPIKPVLDGEPCYEDHPINPFTRKWLPIYGFYTDYDVRKQAYRAVFAGACGHTYGHHAVWQYYTLEHEPVNHPYCLWKHALDRPGATQLRHLRNLILSRPYLNRVPAQELLLSDAGVWGSHIRATRVQDGSYALVYLPLAQQRVIVDLRAIGGGTVRAWWYNPRDGSGAFYADFDAAESHEFMSPPSGPDWVLALDDRTRGFALPGTGAAQG